MAHCIVPERSHSRTFARTRDRGTRSRRQRRGLQTSPGRRARHAIGLSAIAATPMKLRVAIPPRSAWRRSALQTQVSVTLRHSLCGVLRQRQRRGSHLAGRGYEIEPRRIADHNPGNSSCRTSWATRQVHPRQWAGKATAYKRSLRVGSLLSDEEKKRVEPQWENRPRPCLRILSCSACRGPSGR